MMLPRIKNLAHMDQDSPSWTDPLDRSPAKYFHGQKEELRKFQDRMEGAIQGQGGTIFLVQAPPGAGKTALLEEYKKLAGKNGWQTVKIAEIALWNASELGELLGREPEERIIGREQKAGLELHLVGTTGRGITVDSSPSTPLDMLREGESPLLLILDEAQDMADALDLPVEGRQSIKRLLKEIHNGGVGRPLILLAAGLGMTSRVFKSLGASRIDGRSLVELGRLDHGAERAVLEDWFGKDFHIHDGTDIWIDGILEETYGWPHHIMSYVRACIVYMKKHGRTLTETGRELRVSYYEQRAAGLTVKSRRVFTRAIEDHPRGKSLEKEDIMEALQKEYAEEEAKDVFDIALGSGVLYEHKGQYTIPVPSMEDWFVKHYGRGEMPRIQSQNSN